jgi:hypothetical protein
MFTFFESHLPNLVLTRLFSRQGLETYEIFKEA